MSDAPTSCRELRSTVSDAGYVTISITDCDVPSPGDDEVVVRVEAAPINPSDLGVLLAMGDPESAESVVGDDGRPAVRLALSPGVTAAQRARHGRPMVIGNEGGGTVIAAGASAAAHALLGRVVGFFSGNSYAEFRTINVASCLPMSETTTSVEAAAAFVNPLTALGMVETMRLEGHRALVHTVGASNLGLMLNRICVADGVGLVNVVRSQDHVERLRREGAEHVCVSSADSFRSDLVDALAATGATIAFDAIGGGEMASTLLSCMERVASADAGFNRYGSSTHKQIYLYGSLDRGPTVLRRDFGMAWGIGGWLLLPFLARVGAGTAEQLRRRVADEISTTFASEYGAHLALEEVVDPEHVRRYGRVATGAKALITPVTIGV